ncbi:hypothetical protein R1sor_021340 [Riccia sorocarpa]|uniref:Sulfhydryl oxidase n=1 Tax=Riccia sorocarpa TaxID=122646 RepID=A0ABD3GL10_9MARC
MLISWRSRGIVGLLLLLMVSSEMTLSWSRSLGDGMTKDEKDAGHELNFENFNSSLWATPANWALVEFYNRWCPACQKFKPQFEKVAKLFNGPDAPYPGVVLLAKVDCADEINTKLCRRFAIARWPTLLWGKPTALAWGSRTSEQDPSLEQIPIKSAFNANGLLEWINKRLDRSYTFGTTNEQTQSTAANGLGSRQKMVASIQDIEESTAQAYEIIVTHTLLKSKHRTPFIRFLQLLVVHHPSKRCRAGTADALVNIKDAWPAEHTREFDEHVTSGAESETVIAHVEALKRLHLCGGKLPSGHWTTCKSETGGYSCGLWYLFHAISVRVDDAESNTALRTIRGFIENFFVCEECRVHFMKMSASAVETVNTRRGLVLWLWRAHNEVNKRLAEETIANKVHTSRPKIQWPSKRLCPSCRKHGDTDEDSEWDEDNVYRFLKKFYGDDLDTTFEGDSEILSKVVHSESGGSRVEETITNSSVAVPVGAAVGIAIASCGFGVAACCWRLQQKKRKQMRRRI